MSSPALPAPTHVRWRIVGLLMALCFISHFNRIAMSVAGTERIIPEFNFTPTQMGVVYSSFLVVYTAGMVIGGLFIDRLGPRVMLAVMGFGSAVFGALTGGLGFGLVASANLLMALKLVRGAMGLFTTPLHPACARAVSNWMPLSQVSWANGLVTFAAVLGMASTYPIFGALMDWLDWPGAFVVAAGALSLVTACWVFFATDRPEQHRAPNATERLFISGIAGGESSEGDATVESPSSPLFSRSLVLLTLSYAAVGYFQYLFFYWAEYYFKDVMHLSTGQSRTYTTVLILALGIGMPLGGRLADWAQRRFAGRVGWSIVPASGMALSAVFLFLGVNANSPAWIVTLFALAMGALGMSESSFWQAAVELGRDYGATAAAIINTGGNGIGLLAPVLTPWIGAWLGWRMGICLGGIVSVLGALCWFGIDPRPARRTIGLTKSV
jgi:MFS transporter, ACS family, D-galactonate transporter